MIGKAGLLGSVATLLLSSPALALAQAQGARQSEVIEIRGQVPTPQVVTVRPRAIPAFTPDPRVARAFEPAAEGTDSRPAVARGLVPGFPLDSAPPVIAAGTPPAIVPPDTPVRGDSIAAEDGVAVRPADEAAALARQREIAAIREEIERRRARLDSLEQVIRRLGTPEDQPRRNPNTPSDDGSRQIPDRSPTPADRRTAP